MHSKGYSNRRVCVCMCVCVCVCVSVCLSVCLSLKSHLTLEAFFFPENAVTYSVGDEGQNICGIFSKPMRF